MASARLRAQLEQAVRRRAAEIHTRASVKLIHDLDAATPQDTGQFRSRRRYASGVSGSVHWTWVEYPEPLATWLNDGTRPHRIQGRPLLVFSWPKAGKTMFLRHVNHPGSKKHKGWFTRRANAAAWRAALRAAR